MPEIASNRELYCFIADVVRRRAGGSLTLQSYLENLRSLARTMRDREVISMAELAELLEAAFEPTTPRDEVRGPASVGYLAWEARISAQIQDLVEMQATGTLDHEYRYFGVDAPGGGRWYNFDPCTYLECATAGTFGGWEEGDDTGRAYVPGLVAVADASGGLTSMDPRDIEDPEVALSEVTWDTFIDFLDDGQSYE